MSKPATIYRLNYQSFDHTDDNQVYIDISDNDNLIDEDGTQTIIDLVGTGEPDRVATSNTEDPFTVIRAQVLDIQFFGTDSVKASTFSTGSDLRWGVHKYVGAKTIFKGFLNTEDLSSTFMPADGNIITLTANDGLASLKDIPLTDYFGNNPIAENKIIEYISWCLQKTGLYLQINVAFNIKLNGFVDDISVPNTNPEHLFDTCYLHALSFEDQINKSLDCYTVIERILGQEACLFQRQGMWWIMRIDEIEHPTRGLYISTFDSSGNFLANLGAKSFEKQTGIDSPYTIFFKDLITEVVNQRPKKSVELTYKYETPIEIVGNIDFSRGAYVSDLDSDSKKYELDCWTLLRGVGSASTVPNCSAYIQRNYDSLNYEIERYAVITPAAAAVSPINFIQSEPIPLVKSDRFDLSVDYAWGTDAASGSDYTQQVMAVRLFADDGTHYTLDEDGTWYLSDSDWTLNFKILKETWVPDSINETEYRTKSVSAKPLPKTGSVQIMLFGLNQQATSIDNTEVHFANLSFNYYPFINGSYQKYTAESQKVTQAGNFKPKIEADVYLHEGVRKRFKYALLNPLLYVEIYNGSVTFGTPNAFSVPGYKLDLFRKGQRLNISGTGLNNVNRRVTNVQYNVIGNVTAVTTDGSITNETHSASIKEMIFELSRKFYNAAVQPAGPDSTHIHPYSEIQVFDVWNQFRRDMRVFRASLQGLDLGALDSDLNCNEAHLIHKWSFTDTTDDTVNRFFYLMSFDKDYRTAGWTGTFREVYDIIREKDYTGRTFKYIT